MFCTLILHLAVSVWMYIRPICNTMSLNEPTDMAMIGFDVIFVTLSTRKAWADDKLKISQKFQNSILEFGDYIWNHQEKCIQISTNMLGISLEIGEISRILRNKLILYGWWNK